MARDKKRGLARAARATAPAQPSRKRPAKKFGLPRWGVLLLVLVLVGAGVLLGARLLRRNASPGSAGKTAGQSFSGPQEVWALSREASERNDHVGAFRILARGIEQFPNDRELVELYGIAVNNTSYQVGAVRGRTVPVLATSLERVRAVQTAIEAFDRTSVSAPQLASPYHRRGILYAAWGMSDDALRQLYQARIRGDSTDQLTRTANAIVAIQRGAMDVSLAEVGP